MTRLKLHLAILVAACSVWAALGGSYSLNGLSWQDGYSLGSWGCDFTGAKAYAKMHNIPLIAVAGRSTCSYCARFEQMVATAQVRDWAKKRGYFFTINLCDGTSRADATYGTTAENWSGALAFAQTGTKLPFVGVWWPKDKSGREVKVCFNGRDGLMPISSGTFAQQFMDSVDHYVGGYADIAPKTVTITFNGGTTGTTTQRIVVAGSVVGPLPKPTKDNYLFKGWYSDKTYQMPASSSQIVLNATTFYALWEKAVTVKTTISPSASAGSVSGAGTYPEKSVVTMKATPKSGYVFSWWQNGTTKLSQEPTYKHTLGTTAVTLKAVFIPIEKDSVTLEVSPKAEYTRGEAIEPIDIRATGGSRVTLKATGLPAGLTLKDDAISGVPVKSGKYTLSITATTAGKKTLTKTYSVLIRAADERLISVRCAAEEGKVSGGGLAADGKKMTLKATPHKGYAFEGWYDGAEKLSRQTSYPYVVSGRDVELEARFVTIADDLQSIALQVDDWARDVETIVTNRVQQGVRLRWPVVAEALTSANVTVSGLPAGLKLEKTLVDKAEKTYTYAIVGVPASASKINAKTGLIKTTDTRIKVTTGAKNVVTYKTAFIIDPLPVWACGTFTGVSAQDESLQGVGIAKVTVTSAGKASGTFAVSATNGTFSIVGYESLTEDAGRLIGEIKFGKRIYPLELTLTRGEPMNFSCGISTSSEFVASVYRNFWKDGLGLPSPKRMKTSLADWGYPELFATISVAGQVTFAGRLPDGTKVSTSAPLHFNDGGFPSAFLIIPAKKNYGGYFDEIVFD